MKVQTVICLSTTLATLTAAIPNVVPKLSSNPSLGCRSWPQFPYMITVDSAEDEAVNKLPVQPRNIAFGGKALPVLAADLRASKSFAKQPYTCLNGAPILRSSKGEKLSISTDRNNAFILVDAQSTDVLQPELYTHTVNGVQQDGFYLGVNNQTTWGFRYSDPGCATQDGVSKKDYYEVKLLGLPQSSHDTAGYEPEFKGFLKLDTSYF